MILKQCKTKVMQANVWTHLNSTLCVATPYSIKCLHELGTCQCGTALHDQTAPGPPCWTVLLGSNNLKIKAEILSGTELWVFIVPFQNMNCFSSNHSKCCFRVLRTLRPHLWSLEWVSSCGFPLLTPYSSLTLTSFPALLWKTILTAQSLHF